MTIPLVREESNGGCFAGLGGGEVTGPVEVDVNDEEDKDCGNGTEV